MVTGPNPITHFFMKEIRHDERHEAVAKPKREKRVGATIAIREPWTRGRSSRCGGELMWAIALIMSPCGRIEIQNPYVGMNVLQLTCIIWPTGYRVVA